MIRVGLSGGWCSSDWTFLKDQRADSLHDAAVAVVVDGVVIAAAEEERYSREKHTNRFPELALSSCINAAGVDASAIDTFSIFFGEQFLNDELAFECCRRNIPVIDARTVLSRQLSNALQSTITPDKLEFTEHHVAHARSALRLSSKGPRLVFVIDGNGESDAFSVYQYTGSELRRLARHSQQDSLGHFYKAITQFLGFGVFDEYKVMGLAPYGDRRRYASLMQTMYSTLPAGTFALRHKLVVSRLEQAGLKPRHPSEPLLQIHKDLAAAAQSVVEHIIGHVASYWAKHTGIRSISITGGVAQNTSANGRLSESDIFDEISVDSAPHDAGAALGAALRLEDFPMPQSGAGPFLVPDLARLPSLFQSLSRWTPWVVIAASDNIAKDAAQLLSEGYILGWFQGRSEFGPRALGHRSILADPRHPETRDRVNRAVKERESFRPFAPAVMEEHAAAVFELGSRRSHELQHMGIVVQVRPEWRSRLGATTHVDGTSRLQVVSSHADARFHDLLSSFYRLTGVPCLLNTSFNTNLEPIVESVDDAIATFLTSSLDVLVAGDFVLRRGDPIDFSATQLALMPYCDIKPNSAMGDTFLVQRMIRENGPKVSYEVTAATAKWLTRGSEVTPLQSRVHISEEVGRELLRLWQLRLIRVRPK